MSRLAQIEERLRAALEPEALALTDDSAAHAGHAGAASGGGHYHLSIVSPQVVGKLRVARHRMVYAALGDLMQQQIHALAITALTPAEATLNPSTIH